MGDAKRGQEPAPKTQRPPRPTSAPEPPPPSAGWGKHPPSKQTPPACPCGAPMAHPTSADSLRHTAWLNHGWPDAVPRPKLARTASAPWGFRAAPTKRHDGDSFWVLADTGFGGRAEPELRLLDVHAPETRSMRVPMLMQPGGQETTDYVAGWLKAVESRSTRRWCLWVETTMTTSYEPIQRQSFTRYLAVVYDFDRRSPEMSLNAAVATFLSGHPEWPGGE